jgi:hypothetical protein
VQADGLVENSEGKGVAGAIGPLVDGVEGGRRNDDGIGWRESIWLVGLLVVVSDRTASCSGGLLKVHELEGRRGGDDACVPTECTCFRDEVRKVAGWPAATRNDVEDTRTHGGRLSTWLKSRRTLALPTRCVEALLAQREQQSRERDAAGSLWREHDLVFASKVGTPLDPAHVRRDFRRAIRNAAGLDAKEWTPRELRHSFVSLLSDRGVPLEEISQLVGHSSTAVTELVYRKQIRPVLQGGAVVMDRIFQ